MPRSDYDFYRSGISEDYRFCPRFSLTDWRHSGVLDMFVGNYLGEMLFVPNSGTARLPQYRWLGSLDRLRVPTHDQNRLWANLLSPVAYNWTGGSKPDLICGEGTYSANAIHLFGTSVAATRRSFPAPATSTFILPTAMGASN